MDIPGPAGALEAQLIPPPAGAGGYALLCHPHPLYGGDMHDAVLDAVARAVSAAGCGTLRFNFRGVGASEGSHDGGRGEVEDVLAAAAWLEAEHAPAPLIVGGYSFGAAMVWQALAKLPTPGHVLLVAPPVGMMAFEPRTLACPVDVFAGDADQFVSEAALAAWPGIRTHRIAGADHFFAGVWDQLEARVRAALAAPVT